MVSLDPPNYCNCCHPPLNAKETETQGGYVSIARRQMPAFVSFL